MAGRAPVSREEPCEVGEHQMDPFSNQSFIEGETEIATAAGEAPCAVGEHRTDLFFC